MKNLIIFHYHFLPGGVTDVVVSAVRSYLQFENSFESITLVSGREDNLENTKNRILSYSPNTKSKIVKTEVVKALDYIEKVSPAVKSDDILELLLQKFGHSENIWWIHNYHLGKNPNLTEALLKISYDKVQKMVFHIHDFPECSRYPLLTRLKETVQGDLYSNSPNVRYTVINKRDYNNLLDAGLDKSKVFLLENPIDISSSLPSSSPETGDKLQAYFAKQFPNWKKGMGYMLYPVRAIRRKNVGEASLLALMTGKNLIVSLPGVSSTEKRYSDNCLSFFAEGHVPGLFGIGKESEKAGVSFHQLIASANLILSTSVQEGFGYLFLNSMNWGKPLFAKDLDILESFKPSFTEYDAHFYEKIQIPKDLVSVEKLTSLYKEKISRLEQLIKGFNSIHLREELDQLLSGNLLDFSYLSLSMQKDVIKHVAKDSSLKSEIVIKNQSIVNIVEKFYFSDCSHRKDILEQNWSYQSYNEQSCEIMQSFEKPDPDTKHKENERPVYESLVNKFATLPYLRLIYDE